MCEPGLCLSGVSCPSPVSLGSGVRWLQRELLMNKAGWFAMAGMYVVQCYVHAEQ